jgi:hypothetical protein
MNLCRRLSVSGRFGELGDSKIKDMMGVVAQT